MSHGLCDSCGADILACRRCAESNHRCARRIAWGQGGCCPGCDHTPLSIGEMILSDEEQAALDAALKQIADTRRRIQP